MEAKLAIVTSSCAHCGLPLEENSVSRFCCNGCKAVYELLNQTGLGGFYERRESGYCFKKPEPVSQTSTHDFSKWKLAAGQTQLKLYIEGIHCTACIWILEKLPEILPADIRRAAVEMQSSILTLELAAGADVTRIANQIQSWGYTPHWIHDDGQAKELNQLSNRKSLIELAIAGALSGNVMLMSIPLYSGVTGTFETYFEWISFALAVPSLFYCGRSFFKNVWYGLRSGRFPIDAPILLALLIAFFYSAYSLLTGGHTLYFDSMTALVFLLLSSRYYLAKLRQSASLNLGVLEFFQPQYDGSVGDREKVTAGTVLAFDGVVVHGEVWVDLSRFSGESVPVLVQPGNPVWAGTLITSVSGEAVVRVTHLGETTRIAALLKKVKDSRNHRSKSEILSDRLSRGLLMIVTAIGMAALAYFINRGQAQDGLQRVLALLIVTCPCALALATPLTFSMAMKQLLSHKVLIKDPDVLDRASQLSRVYFDKTGTLTYGDLKVAESPLEWSQEYRHIVYSLALHSTHPVSRALYRSLESLEAAWDPIQWDHIEERPGVGVYGRRGGDTYSLRRSSFSCSDMGSVSLFSQAKDQAEREVLTIHVADQLRQDSKSVLDGLKAQGVEPVILSGDHLRAVAGVATQLGNIEAHGMLSPEDKALKARDGMMVGDGLNDALSLASSQVGIAVQGGMEAAIASSQVIGLKPGISTVLDLVRESKKVQRAITQNFILSTTYNCIGAYLSLTGRMNPLLAAVLMPMSAVTVFTATLYRFRERKGAA